MKTILKWAFALSYAAIRELRARTIKLDDDRWHHVLIVRDPKPVDGLQEKVYVDGLLMLAHTRSHALVMKRLTWSTPPGFRGSISTSLRVGDSKARQRRRRAGRALTAEDFTSSPKQLYNFTGGSA